MKNPMRYTAMFLALAGSLYAIPEVEGIDAAVAKAAAEGRTVLVDFTGSDWCKPCAYLKEQIIGSEEFEKAVGDKYVLTPVDFPRLPQNLAKLSDADKRYRQGLMDRYQVNAFPTIILMDGKGKPFARVASARREVAEYLEVLAEAQAVLPARDEAFAKAAAAQGLERAQLLDAALKTIEEPLRVDYPEVVEEIMELDTADTLGYKARKAHAEALAVQGEELSKLIITKVRDTDRSEIRAELDKINKFLERGDLVPEIRQAAYICASDCHAFLNDLDSMLECKKKALEADQSNPRIVKRLTSDINYIQNELIPGLKAEGMKK